MFLMHPNQSFGRSVVKGSTNPTLKSGPHGLRSPVSMASARHVAMVTKHIIIVYGSPATMLAV